MRLSPQFARSVLTYAPIRRLWSCSWPGSASLLLAERFALAHRLGGQFFRAATGFNRNPRRENNLFGRKKLLGITVEQLDPILHGQLFPAQAAGEMPGGSL